MSNKIYIEIGAENAELLKKLTGSANALKQFGATSKSVSGSMSSTFQQVTTSIASVIYIARSLKDTLTGLVKPSYDYAKTMETTQYGMAGILMSMTEINGQAVTFSQAMSISADVIKRLNDEALRTSATSQELTQVFQAILAPAVKAGMKLEEIIKLTSAGTNAVKSLGLSQNQVVQEMRDLVAGGITPASSTLATALGLKDSDIKAAKASAEGLYSFLMERLKGFEILSGKFGDTLTGKLDQAKEAATRMGAAGFQPVFDELKTVLDEVIGKMVKFNKETGEVQLNKELTQSIKEFADDCVTASKTIRQIISDLNEWEKENGLVVQGLKFIADNWKWVLAAALYFFTPLGALFRGALSLIFNFGTKTKGIATIFTELKTAAGWLGEAIKNAFSAGKLAGFLTNLKTIWQILKSSNGVMALVMAVAGILGLRSVIGGVEGIVDDAAAKVEKAKSWADRKKEEDTNEKEPIKTTSQLEEELKAKFGNSGDEKAGADAQRRINKAQRELIAANMEAETNIIKDGLERQQKALDDAKEDGLLSIRQYWQDRLKVDMAGLDAEIKQKEAALDASLAEGKAADTEADRLNSEAQSVKIQAELDILRAKRGDLIIENARKLADEEEKLADLYKTVESKLANMTGDTLTARLNEIDAQYKDMLEKFKAEGGAQYDTLLKVVDMEKAKANYDALLEKVDILKAKLANDILPIQQAMQDNTLDSITGQQMINDLTADYGQKLMAMIPTLQKWAELAGADPAVIENLRKLGIEFKNMAKQSKAAGEIIKESFVNNLEDAFVDILTKTKSISDAFKDMADAVLKEIARIWAKKWATSIVSSLGFAGGGYVAGAGTGTSDSIPAWLSNGEYVLKADAVRRWGVAFLDRLNYGVSSLRGANIGNAFADGGLVNGAGNGGSTNSVLAPINVYGGYSNSFLAGLRSEIEDVVINYLAREAKA